MKRIFFYEPYFLLKEVENLQYKQVKHPTHCLVIRTKEKKQGKENRRCWGGVAIAPNLEPELLEIRFTIYKNVENRCVENIRRSALGALNF